MGVSDDTILRLLKRPWAAAGVPEHVRVLGIDDWAWQKGQHYYGTILGDLERRRLDVLAVRTADAVATWLDEHPDIQVISRDRTGVCRALTHLRCRTRWSNAGDVIKDT